MLVLPGNALSGPKRAGSGGRRALRQQECDALRQFARIDAFGLDRGWIRQGILRLAVSCRAEHAEVTPDLLERGELVVVLHLDRRVSAAAVEEGGIGVVGLGARKGVQAQSRDLGERRDSRDADAVSASGGDEPREGGAVVVVRTARSRVRVVVHEVVTVGTVEVVGKVRVGGFDAVVQDADHHAVARLVSKPRGRDVHVDPGSDAGGVGYGFNVNDYLDPSMAFQMSQGLNALQNSAAARGNLNSGQTLKDILAYSQGLAGQDFNNAFNRAANVRDFTYGVDTGDRAFAYNAMNNDRNFNYNTLRDLAGMGLSGAGQASNADTALSGLIASLMSNQGQIQGAGAVGGSNSINSIISAILNQILQSRFVNGALGG